MASVIGNPMSFTNADEGSTDHINALGTSGRLKITGIRWVGATTATHQAIITNSDGRVIWESVCNAANFVDESNILFWLRDGLLIDTLDSGTLYVYKSEC